MMTRKIRAGLLCLLLVSEIFLLPCSTGCNSRANVIQPDTTTMYSPDTTRLPLSSAFVSKMKEDASLQMMDCSVRNGDVAVLATDGDAYIVIRGDENGESLNEISLPALDHLTPERIFVAAQDRYILLAKSTGGSLWDLSYTLCVFSADMTLLSEATLMGLDHSEILDGCYDSSQNCIWVGTETGLYAVDESGAVLAKKSSAENQMFVSVTTCPGGGICVLSVGEKNQLLFMKENADLIERFELKDFPDNDLSSAHITAAGTSDNPSLLLDTSYSVYVWEKKDLCAHQIIDKTFESFIETGKILTDNGRFVTLAIWGGGEAENVGLYSFATVPVETRTVDIAVLGLSETTSDAVKKLASGIRSVEPELNIRFTVYPETLFTEENAGDLQGNAKSLLDVFSGDLPDVFCVSPEYEQLLQDASVFTDLSAFYQADTSFHAEDYLENVWNASKGNGGQYYVTPFFGLTGVLCSGSMQEQTASVEALSQLIDASDKDVHLIRHDTSEQLFDLLWPYYRTGFLSRKGGYNKESMDELLTFCMEYGKEEYVDQVPVSDQIREGKLLLLPCDSSSYEAYLASASVFSGDAYLVGLPGSGVNSPLLTTDFCLSIPEASDQKEDAWKIIAYYLSPGVQSSVSVFQSDEGDAIPINRTVFEDALAEQYLRYMEGHSSYMPPLSDAEDELKMEGIEAILRSIQQGNHDFDRGEMNYVPYPYEKDETYKKFCDAVNKASVFLVLNTGVDTFVSEEAKQYLAGDKSLKQTEEEIGARLALYTKERD